MTDEESPFAWLERMRKTTLGSAELALEFDRRLAGWVKRPTTPEEREIVFFEFMRPFGGRP